MAGERLDRDLPARAFGEGAEERQGIQRAETVMGQRPSRIDGLGPDAELRGDEFLEPGDEI
ncbi:MAG TPA: hypothetical protein VFB81_20365, partial [Myxococcales bacterium]|nr:hypothetical protein [Myxococcales bacterium]